LKTPLFKEFLDRPKGRAGRVNEQGLGFLHVRGLLLQLED
jgi:hypothetical protein